MFLLKTLQTWFVWKKRKDNPAFVFQRLPIWICTWLAMKQRQSADHVQRPDILGDLPAAGGNPVIMACCDDVYFARFANKFVKSIVNTCPNLYVHVHIYHPSRETLEAAAILKREVGHQASFSHELRGRSPYLADNPYFFAAGRFAVAARILAAINAPLLILDIDGVIRRDLGPELTQLATWDIGLIRRASRRYQWRKILAGAVLVNPTPAGRLFAARLSSVIERVLRWAPRFHVDQIVIFYLCQFYGRQSGELKIADLGMNWADHLFKNDSLIWSAKGMTRKFDLEQLGSTSDLTGQVP